MTLDEDLPDSLQQYYSTVSHTEGVIRHRNERLEDVFGTFLDLAAKHHYGDDGSRGDLDQEDLTNPDTFDLLDTEEFENELYGVLNGYANINPEHDFGDYDAHHEVVRDQVHEALHGLTGDDYKQAIQEAVNEIPTHQLTGGKFLNYLTEKVPGYEENQQEALQRVRQQAFDKDTLEDLVGHAGAEGNLETSYMQPGRSVALADIYRSQGELDPDVIRNFAIQSDQIAAAQGEAEIAADDYSDLVDEASQRGQPSRQYR